MKKLVSFTAVAAVGMLLAAPSFAADGAKLFAEKTCNASRIVAMSFCEPRS